MHAALQVLSKFRRLAESHKVDEVIAVATSATREAENGGEFLQAVTQQTGIRPRVISGTEEARLIHLAAAPGPVSVYLLGPTGDPISATPILTLAFGAASPYAVVAPGTYRIRVTPAGVPSIVLLDSGSFTAASGSVRTLLLTDAPGGGLPSTLSIIADAN